MITIWKVMWMRSWRRYFPSICSPEQALAQDPPLSLLLAVVPVPPLPMENLLSPAGLVVDHNLPDHHKDLLLISSLVPPLLKAWSPNVHLPPVPMRPQLDPHHLNVHRHLQVEARQQELLDLPVLPDQIFLPELE